MTYAQNLALTYSCRQYTVIQLETVTLKYIAEDGKRKKR